MKKKNSNELFDDVLFYEIVGYENEMIYEWPYKKVDDHTRVYYKPFDGVKMGFVFFAVTMLSCNENDEKKIFDDKSLSVEVFKRGWANSEGIDTEFNIYRRFPSIDREIKSCKAVKRLCMKYCVNYE